MTENTHFTVPGSFVSLAIVMVRGPVTPQPSEAERRRYRRR